MKKVLISMGFIALALGATAQVKIKDGTVTGSSTTPNTNAILELESNNKGVMFPRVALTSTSSAAPLSAHVKGMVVYDTVSAGSGATAVSPGIYYNDGTQWVRAAQNSNPDWLIFGNASSAVNGTPAGNTDSQYVMGRVGIGQNTMQRLYDPTAGGDSAHKFAYLAVNGDASINGITVGQGGGGGSQNFNNTTVGSYALYNNTTGDYNAAVGRQALQSNTTGQFNTALGYLALQNNTTGYGNSAMGYWALRANTTGISNSAMGSNALGYNTKGSSNTAVGAGALANDTTGGSNSAMGSGALSSNRTGGGNSALGNSAGGNLNSGNNNIAIGNNTNFPNTNGNYQLNIGNAIWGTGVDSTTTNAANIGINTNAPTSSFYVNGSQGGSIRVQSASYGPTATDYTVVFTGGGAVTATLPPATGIAGRMYRIVASGDGTTVTVFSTSGTVMLLPTITTLTGQSAIFQSDGTTWYQVQ